MWKLSMEAILAMQRFSNPLEGSESVTLHSCSSLAAKECNEVNSWSR
jgi:hypothetical protein